MKLAVTLCLLALTGCTKSETQYQNLTNAKETVNDKRSDTIKTVPEISDTLSRQTSEPNHSTQHQD